MSGIYIYRGDIKPEDFSSIRAMLTFGAFPDGFSIGMVKHFSEDEARKGLEQLKRWVSTGSFKKVLLYGFAKAVEKGNTEHILEWLEDHSSEPDFPTLILIGDGDSKVLSSISKTIDSEEELLKVINA